MSKKWQFMTREELALNFAEYISEEHYSLCNIKDGVCYWRNEDETITTADLLEKFKIESEYMNKFKYENKG